MTFDMTSSSVPRVEISQYKENIYQALFESAGEGLIVADREGIIKLVNPHLLEMFGYEQDELIGEKIEKLIPDKLRKKHVSHRKEYNKAPLKRPMGTGMNLSAQKRNGMAFPVEISLNHLGSGEDMLIMALITDTTKRKAVEEKLKQSERRFFKAFHAAPVAYAIGRIKDGVFVNVNESFQGLTGYNIREIKGKTALKLADCITVKEQDRILSKLRKKQALTDLELVIFTKKGDPRICLVYAEIIELDSEPCFLAIFNDITARKEAADELQNEKDIAQRYLDIAGVMILVVGIDERVSLINKQGCKILGYKATEIIGKNWMDDFVPASVRRGVRDHFRSLISGKVDTPDTYENIISTRNGERLLVWHNTIVRNELGKILGTLSSGEDITEKRETEINIRKIESNMRGLYAIASNQKLTFEAKIRKLLQFGSERFNLPVGILSKIEGDQYHVQEAIDFEKFKGITYPLDHTFCYNVIKGNEPLYIEHTGRSKWHSHPCYKRFKLESYLGAKVLVEGNLYGTLNFSSPEPREISFTSTDRELLKLMAEWIGQEIQIQISKDRLRQLNVELEKRVDERTEELADAIHILEETNERLEKQVNETRRAQKALEESQREIRSAYAKEKELSELKSSFMTTASHEFRTPLSAILSSASLIGKYIRTEQNEQRTRHINRIKSSVKNLTEILNDFLSLEKLEEGKVQLKPETIDLVAFFNEVIEQMQAIAKAGQIIEYTHHGGRNELSSDKQLLQNILINLISNAIKYSAEGKRISIATAINRNKLTIEIKDRGYGIAKRDQSNIFKRFFRAKNAANEQGTGLGLNIVRKYVELMGGKLDFKSVLSKGTTFTVNLPLNS